MEGLFNLLLESPIFLFIIIAAIMSFLRGNKQDEKQTRRQRPQGQQQRRTPSQSEEEQEVDWRDIFRQEERPTEPQSTESWSNRERSENKSYSEPTVSSLPQEAENELSKTNRELHERYERIKKRQEQAAKQVGEIGDSPIMQGDLTRSAAKPKVQLNFSHISREEAIKGIVWSEILAKPKARRR
ncbi:hypothetical protein HXA35_08585 [Bacillus sp. A301a_S52]|nr:hypothetical protein [Bacillus sp. A301a_S52]